MTMRDGCTVFTLAGKSLSLSPIDICISLARINLLSVKLEHLKSLNVEAHAPAPAQPMLCLGSVM